MNERVVYKLLDQARAECFRMGSKPATTVGYDELEKLVELVVRECIDIVAAGGEFASRPKLRIVEKLQQHFGVE